MARRKLKPGARVKLVVPAVAFAGMDPDPVPIGSLGVVEELREGGSVVVLWDMGIRADHNEDEVLQWPCPGARRRMK